MQNQKQYSGSFFFQVEDVPSEVAVDFYFWARDYPVTDAAQEVEITKKFAIASPHCSWDDHPLR